MKAMVKAVLAVDPEFKLILSVDGSGNITDFMVNTIYNASFSPVVYKTDDGAVVVAPFYPERLGIYK